MEQTFEGMGGMPPSRCGGEEERRQPLIHQLARALWACKHAYDAGLGINAAAVWVLSLLAEQDGRTQHELTTTIRTDPSMITRLIQELERELGWIRRERDPRDNRLVRVYLTDTGREQARSLAGRVAALEARLTQGLGDEGERTLRALLQTLERTARADDAPQPPVQAYAAPGSDAMSKDGES